jgi:dTDP-4-amino-4,6-dideoxygalactose transaminase
VIPFLDLKRPYIELKEEIDSAVSRVLSSGWYIGGPEVETFEAKFAAYCDARFAVGVASGLDALFLSLKAMGVGPGDEVIVPSNTYIATWLAVTRCGANPVPVEPLERTFNIDPSRIENAITPKTKVILPVHLYGLPADMAAICALARRHGLYVLEDAAQAHGAKYMGAPIGTHGDIVAWSFYPGKNLGAIGDAGCITTNNEDLAGQIEVLRNYGSRHKYENEVVGYNSRLDPIQAAVLNVKLAHLERWVGRRKEIAGRYRNEISNKAIQLPAPDSSSEHAWHLFVIRSKERESLQKRLSQEGVSTLIHYPIPPHMQQAYRNLELPRESLPIANRLADEVISLPLSPYIDDKSLDIVIDAVNAQS